MNKKLAMGIAAGASAFAAVTASASTLGGITTEKVGASTQVIASCDSDGVALAYDTAFADGAYKVTDVTLSDIAAPCAGQSVTITLFDGSDSSLATLTADNTGTSQSFSLDSPISAKKVVGAAVVIEG